MLASIEKLLVDGPGGAIELALDWPANLARQTRRESFTSGIRIRSTAARWTTKSLPRSRAHSRRLGWLAVRFNFRGVGRSAGEHDEGNGETEDFLHLIDTVPTLPAVSSRLSGFTADRRRRFFVRQFCRSQGRARTFCVQSHGQVRRADRRGGRQMADATSSARSARHSRRAR